VFPSIRNISVTALNVHIGLEADERFAMALTGEEDFDGDGKVDEASAGQVSAIVAFEASLPVPRALPFDNADWQASAEAGRAVFTRIGCASCHVAELPLHSLKFMDPGPNDSAGTLSSRDVDKPAIYDLSLVDSLNRLPRNADGDVMVPIFSDLKRHQIADTAEDHFANEVQSQAFVARDIFLTQPLWSVADTAPYGHRGDLSTLTEAILSHGGEGRDARDAFAALPTDDANDLIAFLKTLRAPQ
jgi:CxxC motif-containing protein (DUF1111 family)